MVCLSTSIFVDASYHFCNAPFFKAKMKIKGRCYLWCNVIENHFQDLGVKPFDCVGKHLLK